MIDSDYSKLETPGEPLQGRSPLGNNYGKSFRFPEGAENRRIFRYLLQSVIAYILPNERVSRCMRYMIPKKDHVNVFYSGQVKRAHYGNLAVCGSPWACPVCSAKITERRRLELDSALNIWTGGVFMAAFTLQHSRDERLQVVQDRLSATYKSMQGGRFWMKFKTDWGFVGSIGSSEVTWGEFNGWHPHRHVLFFTREKIEKDDLEIAQAEVSSRFRDILASHGGYADEEHGVKFTIADDYQKAGDYVCKWGLAEEMTKGPVKKGRMENYSPFELAGWAGATGETLPIALFREYFAVYKGSKQLSYSHGLRARLGIMDVEKTDEQLATEESEEAILLAELARQAWKIVCKDNKRGELLEVASSGNPEAVRAFLLGLGLQEGFKDGFRIA